MPTIKLLSGSYRAGDNRYTPKSEPFQVSDKIAKLLHCSVVPDSKPTPPPAPPPARSVKGDTPKPVPNELTALRAQALAKGIDVKPQWSAAKLQHEIATNGG